MAKRGEKNKIFNFMVPAKQAAVVTLIGMGALLIVGLVWTSLFGGISPKMPMYDYGMGSSEGIAVREGKPSSTIYPPMPISPVVNTPDRKVITTGSLDVFVDDVEAAVENIRGIAGRLGGFVGNVQVYEVSTDTKAASMAVRVPATRFQEAMVDIKKLASKVERESVDSQDVTGQVVDVEARLRNLRAEEAQYVKIMEDAETVEDTLQVAAHLSRVRGEIEILASQLTSLQNQVVMATINVTLTSEADVEVFGIRWKPLFVIKQAFRDMLAGIVDYVNTLIQLFFRLPLLLLWLATIVAVALVLWHIALWIKRQVL